MRLPSKAGEASDFVLDTRSQFSRWVGDQATGIGQGAADGATAGATDPTADATTPATAATAAATATATAVCCNIADPTETTGGKTYN